MTTMPAPRVIAALCLLIAAARSDAAPPSLEALATRDQFSTATLSPDGSHVAIVRPRERGSSLVIVDVSTLTAKSELRFSRYQHVLDVSWANDDIVVVSKGSRQGALLAPRWTGELYATSIDGKLRTNLFGFNRGKAGRGQGRSADLALGWVIDTLPDDETHVLTADIDWSSDHAIDFQPRIRRIDVVSGAREQITEVPLTDVGIVVDHSGAVRYAFGRDRNLDFSTLRFEADGARWVSPGPAAGPAGALRPLLFAPDNASFLATYGEHGEAGCLYRVDAETLARTRVTCEPGHALRRLMPSTVRGQPLAAVYEIDGPRAHLLQPQSDEAHLYRELSARFAPHFVEFLQFSDDGKRLLYLVHGDREPGLIYLHDQASNASRLLFQRQPLLADATLAPSGAFEFAARDGTRLHGILTVPPEGGRRNLPLVVMPHGGPYGISDTRGFDADAQVLATRGYAVLKVNFRGSGGYGEAFERSGYRQWGKAIQDDIADAVHWIVERGHADPDRICIVGASFGAYSALMNPIRNPDLYRCAVGYAGVYDLDLMFERGDIKRTERGRRYLDLALGSDEADLAAQSPTRRLDELKVPVLIVHGSEDQRAPPAHAKALRDGLQKQGKPHEWLLVNGEGHGFFIAANRVQYFERLLGFLARNIGTGAAGNPPGASP